MKKLCALLLCTTMLLTSFIFADAETSAISLTGTFDDLTVGSVAESNLAGYSNVFRNSTYFNLKGATASVTADGYRGNAVTFVEDGDASGSPMRIAIGNNTSVFAPTDDSPVYLSFKMKIVNSVNNTADFRIYLANSSSNQTVMLAKPNGGNYYWWHAPNETGTRFGCVEGEWVDVQIKMTASKTEAKVTDSNGNVNGAYRNTKADYIYITERGNSDKGTAGASFALDEIRISQGNEANAPNLVETSLGTTPVTTSYHINENLDNFTPDGDTGNYPTRPLHETLANRTTQWKNVTIYENDYFKSVDYYADDCNGGKCLEFTLNGAETNRQSYVGTVGHSCAENSVFTSFKLKIIDDKYNGTTVTDSRILDIGFGTYGAYDVMVRNGVIKFWNYYSRSIEYKYTADTWYTFVFEHKTVNGAIKVFLKVYDDKGNCVVNQEPSGGALSKSSYSITDSSIWITHPKDGSVDGAQFAIDNFKVFTATSTQTLDSNTVIATEILGKTANTNNVAQTTMPTIIASFDNILSAASSASFTAGDSSIPANIAYTGSSLVEITPNTPLEYDTEYSLNITAKGLSGASKTEVRTIKTIPYTMGTMTYDTPVYEGTTALVTVNFTNSNLSKLNATVIGVLTKNDKLEYCSVQTLKDASLGSNTLTFTNLPEDRTGMEFRLYVWDNFTSLKPLFR